MRNFLTAGLSLADPNRRNSAKLAKAVCILAAVFMFGQMLFQAPAQASVEGYVDGGYKVGTTTYPLMKGVFHSPSNLPMRFFYTDGFFAEDPYTYNTHLATASLSMAISGMYTDGGEYSTRSRNIVQFMKDIGTADYYLNAYNKLRPTTDSIGVTMGWKPLSDDRILIPIAVRGANYEKEWASNVTLGDGTDTNKEAKGFSDSATLVYNELIEYVKRQDAEAFNSDGTLKAGKKFIFWIAGYSRAAAVSNITAKRLVDLCNGTGSKVFAYCFAAPVGGSASTEKSGVNYRCIHNVIDLGDVVPTVAPLEIDGFFKRYGVDHYIPGSEAGDVKTVFSVRAYDNDSYYYDEAKYNGALALMKVHLSAIDPGANASLLRREIDTSGLDASTVKRLIITTTARYVAYLNPIVKFTTEVILLVDGIRLGSNPMKVLTKTVQKDNLANFVGHFVSYLCTWTELRRNTYVGKDSSTTYGSVAGGSIEGALRDMMTIVHDRSSSQIAEFSNRIKGIKDSAGFVQLIKTFHNVFNSNQWHTMDAPTKKAYIDKFIGWLEDTKCFDALELTSGMREKLVVDMRILIDLFLSFLSQDYVRNLYGTDGFAMILTLFQNIETIGQNHSPNVAMAWVRAQDSLYNTETTRVSASYAEPVPAEEYSFSASSVKAGAAGEQILSDVAAPENINSEHVEDPLSLLNTRTSVTAVYASGAVEELPVTWDTTNFGSYYLHRSYSENAGKWISYSYGSENLDSGTPRLFVFNGKVNMPGNVTNPYNVSTDLTLEVFVAGLPKEETPQALPPDGEYYGSVKVALACPDDEDAEIYYMLIADNSDSELIKYINPITLTLKEGAAESQDFYIAAWNQHNKTGYADSDIAIWHYVIHPVDPDNAVDENGIFRYTLAKTFILSKDEAVCWRINSDDVGDSIMCAVNTERADTVPVKEVVITACSLAEITPAGTYSLPVQTSTDGGKTWTDDSAIKFRTSDLVKDVQNNNDNDKEKDKDNNSTTGSSGGGCNSGFILYGLGAVIFAALMKRRKN